MDLSLEDIGDVLKFIDSLDCAEVEVELGDVHLRVRKQGATSSHQEVEPDPAAPDESSRQERRTREGFDQAPEPVSEVKEVRPEPSPTGGSDDVSTWQAREESGEIVLIRSPMVGTAYRAKEPGAPPFVEIGSDVAASDVVCLVEVMKLFHSVSAGVEGVVEAIIFEDGAAVEYNQPLVAVAPTG